MVITWLCLVLMFLCACAYARPSYSVLPTPSVEPEQTVGVLTPRQALAAMYGNEAFAIYDTEALLPAPVAEYTTTVHINVIACYWEDYEDKCIVITDSAYNTCHACQADIGGAIFRIVNNSWRISVFQRNIISLGSFGYVPKGELIRIGPNKYAVLLRSGWAGQGYEGETVTIIAEIEDSLRVIASFPVGELQESFAKDGTMFFDWGYGSKIEFFPVEDSDFYNILIKQYGIDNQGNKFKRTIVYTFSKEIGKYVLVRQE